MRGSVNFPSSTYKVGDLVKIITNINGHYFTGSVGELISIRNDFHLPFLVDFPGNIVKGHNGSHKDHPPVAKNGWWFYAEELVLAEEAIIDKLLEKYK